MAAAAYDTDELAHTAFGKVNPYQYGVLPVLVIIQNDTGQAVRLEHLQAEYEGIDGSRIEPTPVEEVRFVGTAPQRPRLFPGVLHGHDELLFLRGPARFPGEPVLQVQPQKG